MIAVIDCGTTFTRIFIVDEHENIIAQGSKKVGVRDTSITGSRDTLRNGICELFEEILNENKIAKSQISYAVSSGMITSEIGLIEIPHLTAPISLDDLAANLKFVDEKVILPIGVPVVFVPGIKNDFGKDARLDSIRKVDFMRGEEVQCVGILENSKMAPPVNIVVLSSHTKIINIDSKYRICGSITSLSGQLFEAIISSTSVGKSLMKQEGSTSGGYTEDEIINIACESVQKAGLVRTMLMPRFMEVLLKTNSDERILFADAAIAADDMKSFDEADALGFKAKQTILFGHENRCKLYKKLLLEKHPDMSIEIVSDSHEISLFTVSGALSIMKRAGLKI